jgi:hypothetical protein
MRFPWLSRDSLELARASAVSEHENAQHLRYLLTDVTSRYDALLEKFTALRLAGAVEPAPVIVPPAPREPDALETLVAQQADGDVRKRALMIKQVRKDRASGVSDDEIAMRIIGGMSVTDGVPV